MQRGMDGLLGGSQACWASLPGDIVLMVEAHLSSQSVAGHTASMRATCSTWRHALAAAPAQLQPLGKPSCLSAFPAITALDYSARNAGHSLTDDELAAACRLLGGRLEHLDIGGAFQLSTEGMHSALKACPSLRHLAADGSTLQDAAFAGLLLPPDSAEQAAEAQGSSSSGGSSGGSGSFGAQPINTSTSPFASLPGSSSFSPRGSAISSAPLQRLESLSLRGCLFLRGGSLLAGLAAGCPQLSSLDLSSCGLAFNLNPEVAALLPRLASLRRLALDGNGVDDAAMQHVAALPLLRELSVRGSSHLTDAGLRHLAQMRGSTVLLRSSSSASTISLASLSSASSGSLEAAGAAGDAAGGTVDVGLVSLDISACTGLTDQCWLAITEMQGLTSLRMEHMTHLLQFPSMPEALPAALWRLPRLRVLSLAGSCCHPSKLKLLAATCGSSVTHLDISTGSRGSSSGGGGGCMGTGSGACCCCASMTGVGEAVQAVPLLPPGPAYRRLTALHERDLCEAAQSFRQLQSFSAAGTGLPLRVCTAFLAAAPAGRLARVDLSGCCLEAEHPAAEVAHSQQPPWQRQLFFSSGARRALNFDSYPAVTGTSASRLQQLHAEADSWQRPATAGRFAAALRRQAPSLSVLRLGGASGVTDRHLSSLRALSALTQLCLAGTGTGAVSPTLMADVAAGCTNLQHLDISGTAAHDACLAAVAALPHLRQLAAAGCSGVGAAGAAALAAGPAGLSMRYLDLSATNVDDAAAAELAAGCRQLSTLLLTGCYCLTAAGVEQLGRLPNLATLSLARCPKAVTDASLAHLAARLPLLTRLSVAEASQLTAAGVMAALPLLPCLSQLDLTCCWQIKDEQLLAHLAQDDHATAGSGRAAMATATADGGACGGSSSSSKGSRCGGGGLTPANVQLPQGGSSPTGSPFKRRAPRAAT